MNFFENECSQVWTLQANFREKARIFIVLGEFNSVYQQLGNIFAFFVSLTAYYIWKRRVFQAVTRIV